MQKSINIPTPYWGDTKLKLIEPSFVLESYCKFTLPITMQVESLLITPEFLTYMLMHNPLRRIKLHSEVIGLWQASHKLRQAHLPPIYTTFHIGDDSRHIQQYIEMMVAWGKLDASLAMPKYSLLHDWRATTLGHVTNQCVLKSSGLFKHNVSADIRAWINALSINKLSPSFVVAVPHNARECAFAMICAVSLLRRGGDALIEFAHVDTAVMSILRACTHCFQEITIEPIGDNSAHTPYLLMRGYKYLTSGNIIRLHKFIDNYNSDISAFVERFYETPDVYGELIDAYELIRINNASKVAQMMADFHAGVKSHPDGSADWLATYEPPNAAELLTEDASI